MAKWHIENPYRIVLPKWNQGNEWAIAYCGLYFNLYKRRVRDDTCKRCITMRGTESFYRQLGVIIRAKKVKLPKRIIEKEFGLSD